MIPLLLGAHGVLEKAVGEVAVANIQSEAHISLSDVRKVLLKHMPPNTIPKVINFVERIERTETGKKKRLSAAL